MKIYMVRHGRTDWNDKEIMQGISNISLNKTGEKQALLARQKLKDVNFDICISSPLERTKKTAEIIIGDKCDIICDDLLLERGMGSLEGKPYELYKKNDYWNYKKNSSENKVESITMLLERTKEFLDKIKKKYSSKTILIVSHSATIRALHFNIKGYDENTNFYDFVPENGGVYEYYIMDNIKVKTIEKDEEYLRQLSKDVSKDDPSLDLDIKTISDFCKTNEVFAMASVQLGIPKKIIYLKNTNDKDIYNTNIDEERIMINPKIIEEKGETYFWEACASCLDNMGKVKRPYEIKVSYYDRNFNKKEETLTGFESTVFSHEYDHMYGILHIDIAEKVLVMSVEEREKFRQKEGNGYVVVSKTSKYEHPIKEKRNVNL